MYNMTKSDTILSLSNPNFCVYLICSCILVIKMISITFLTIYKRLVHKVALSPEDAAFSKGEIVVNDAVERTRRAHLNDLENIPMFWTASFAYLWTNPNHAVVLILFFGFTLFRIFHTIVYAVVVIRQPARAICFFGGFLITLYLAMHSLIYIFIHYV